MVIGAIIGWLAGCQLNLSTFGLSLKAHWTNLSGTEACSLVIQACDSAVEAYRSSDRHLVGTYSI